MNLRGIHSTLVTVTVEDEAVIQGLRYKLLKNYGVPEDAYIDEKDMWAYNIYDYDGRGPDRAVVRKATEDEIAVMESWNKMSVAILGEKPPTYYNGRRL